MNSSVITNNSQTLKDPLQDGKSRIELIDSMGGDLSIVNDARAVRFVLLK